MPVKDFINDRYSLCSDFPFLLQEFFMSCQGSATGVANQDQGVSAAALSSAAPPLVIVDWQWLV